jgi:hypothetical protein
MPRVCGKKALVKSDYLPGEGELAMRLRFITAPKESLQWSLVMKINVKRN